MKKLCSIGLSALLMLGVGTAAMATNVETTGELNFSYNGHHWTGQEAGYTWTEIGIKNHIPISDVVSGDVNFWYATTGSREFENGTGSVNGTSAYAIDSKVKFIDAAYVTFKLGQNSLKVGYDTFALDGSLNVLGDFTKGLVGDLKPAAVQLLGTMPIDNFTVQAGYFRNVGGSFYNDLEGDDGRNSLVLKGSYVVGKIDAGLTCIVPGKASWETVDPAMEYILNAGYKLNDKYKVYAAFVGADRSTSFDNNKQNPNNWSYYTPDQTDNFAILGFSASLGKLWLAAEYTVLTPSKEDTYIYVDYPGGGGTAHNWADNPPFGFKLSYWFGNNTTLEYTRVVDTGDYNDKDRLRLQVKF